MRTKQAKDIVEMIADIYKFGPLTYPNGSEFKGEVTKMLEKCGVKILLMTTKFKHTHGIRRGFEQATHIKSVQGSRYAKVKQS